MELGIGSVLFCREGGKSIREELKASFPSCRFSGYCQTIRYRDCYNTRCYFLQAIKEQEAGRSNKLLTTNILPLLVRYFKSTGHKAQARFNLTVFLDGISCSRTLYPVLINAFLLFYFLLLSFFRVRP